MQLNRANQIFKLMEIGFKDPISEKHQGTFVLRKELGPGVTLRAKLVANGNIWLVTSCFFPGHLGQDQCDYHLREVRKKFIDDPLITVNFIW